MAVKSWTRNKPPTESTPQGKAAGLRLKKAWTQLRQNKISSVSAPTMQHAQTFHQTKAGLGAHKF